MEITGKLIQKLPIASGTSKTGNPWQKQEFVIETEDSQYPKKVCANLWGDRTNQLNQYNIGDTIKVSFDLESREFNGKWYTDVKAWKIEHAQPGMPEPQAYDPAGIQTQHTAYTPPTPVNQPATELPGQSPEPFQDTFTDEGAPDDLPF